MHLNTTLRYSVPQTLVPKRHPRKKADPGAAGPLTCLPGVCSLTRTQSSLRGLTSRPRPGAAAFSLGSVTAEHQRQLVNEKRPPGVGLGGSKSISPIRAFSSPRKAELFRSASAPKSPASADPRCRRPGQCLRGAGGDTSQGPAVPLGPPPASTVPEGQGHGPGSHRWKGAGRTFCYLRKGPRSRAVPPHSYVCSRGSGVPRACDHRPY